MAHIPVQSRSIIHFGDFGLLGLSWIPLDWFELDGETLPQVPAHSSEETFSVKCAGLLIAGAPFMKQQSSRHLSTRDGNAAAGNTPYSPCAHIRSQAIHCNSLFLSSPEKTLATASGLLLQTDLKTSFRWRPLPPHTKHTQNA